jgi:hypothetical protein
MLDKNVLCVIDLQRKVIGFDEYLCWYFNSKHPDQGYGQPLELELEWVRGPGLSPRRA